MTNLLIMRNLIKADHFLNDSDYDSIIDDAIRTTIADHEFDRWWFLEKTSTLTLPMSSSTLLIPTAVGSINFIDVTYQGGRGRLQDMTLKQLTSMYYGANPLPSEPPQAYAISYRTLHFSHRANVQHSLPYMYYARDSVLPVNDSDTSIWFGREGSNMIKTQASLRFATEVLNDPAFSPLPAQAAKISMDNRQQKARIY